MGILGNTLLNSSKKYPSASPCFLTLIEPCNESVIASIGASSCAALALFMISSFILV